MLFKVTNYALYGQDHNSDNYGTGHINNIYLNVPNIYTNHYKIFLIYKFIYNEQYVFSNINIKGNIYTTLHKLEEPIVYHARNKISSHKLYHISSETKFSLKGIIRGYTFAASRLYNN